jgi:SAM-dependent methyltransferase
VSFKDHFSTHAAAYADFRPRYPAELFEYLAEVAPGRHTAWDCGTGNGQAALGLASHFECVIATDPSSEQLRNAFAHPRISYHVAPAEASEIDSRSVDLITVAQALHWTDLDRFFAEARRVLRPRGVLAVWCYDVVRVSPEIDSIVDTFYRETVGAYWPPERALVEDHYRSIHFPFEELNPPAVAIEFRWTLSRLLGFLRTWSATRKFIQREGFDPVEAVGASLGRWWPDPDEPKIVRWPLYMRVGRA